jgi:hypothetical protein
VKKTTTETTIGGVGVALDLVAAKAAAIKGNAHCVDCCCAEREEENEEEAVVPYSSTEEEEKEEDSFLNVLQYESWGKNEDSKGPKKDIRAARESDKGKVLA